jgi:hypothetical protein
LRDGFEALLIGAPDYEWIEPQLDSVKVIAEPLGAFSIDAVGEPPEYRLMWRSKEGAAVDLSNLQPEAAVETVFGETGVEEYRKWADFLPSPKG